MRRLKKNDSKEQSSFESTEPSSSVTPRAGSSQDSQTYSSILKSQSSICSPDTTSASTSKNVTSPLSQTSNKDTNTNTNTKSSDKSKPLSSGSNKKKQKKQVNIQENPLDNPLNKRCIQRRQSSTDTQKSIKALPSLDSNEGVAEAGPSNQTAPAVSREGVSFESLSSVTTPSDTFASSYEQYTFEEPIQEEKPDLYYRAIQEIIHPKLSDVIARSIPICSQLLQRQSPEPEEQYEYQITQDWLKEFQVVSRPGRRHSAPDILDHSPPSPAPGTPIVDDCHYYEQDFIAFKEANEVEQIHVEPYVGTKWWTGDNAKVSSGPRVVVLKIPGDTEDCTNYNIVPPDSSSGTVHPRQSYYGSDSPTKPFRSYLDPNPISRDLNQDNSFASNIHKAYKARKKRRRPPKSGTIKMDDQERKIIIEFCHLLEKSKQLFNGLRELPQYGHKQWSLYFGRTFDIYTRLWKYQQQHRGVLDSKYGMKRWQIGEIASKIGQLYYHFYLRTSETAYLSEAFAFYSAIRGRCYYTKANKEDKCELMVKKLRYYARFIVVCLLLKKMKLVKDLIKELDRQIIEYGNTYDPDDQVEWTVVVDEVKAFIHAEPVVAVIHPDNYAVTLSHRLTSIIIPPVERSAQMTLSMQEILIVGSSSQQVKFSELTIDMFRMLQTLEREPSAEVHHSLFDDSPRHRYDPPPSAPHRPEDVIESSQKIPNPHKYLLFKPTPSQLLVYLASGCHDLPPNGALLLYISADGHVTPHPSKHADEAGYDAGGLITTSKNDIYRECSKDPKAPSTSKFRELHSLYPGDLFPFARKPFFLIVDSDNSYAFQNIPRQFGQPLVILMSPLELPSSFHDGRQQGSIFTLFLHSPLSAVCYLCDITNISLVHWDRGQIYIDTFMGEASAIFVRSRPDMSYIAFMGDEFFRLLLLRYVFCEVVLRMHRGFRARAHLTRCSPPLSDDLFEHPTLVHIVMDLANHLQVRSHFHDPTISSGQPPTTKD